jgi:hypothetical protein
VAAKANPDKIIRARFGSRTPIGDFCSYVEAHATVQRFGFRSSVEFRRWCRDNPTERKRLRLRYAPQQFYENWAGWRAFLGTSGTSGARRRAYLHFRQARAVVRDWAIQNDITDAKTWRRWAKAHHELLAQHRIPANPNVVLQYKQPGQRFISYADWLGTNTKSPKSRAHR